MSKDADIPDQLEKLIRLVSILVTKDMLQREQILVLSKAGFQPKDIADLIGTTPHTVSVTLSDMKKHPKKSKERSNGKR